MSSGLGLRLWVQSVVFALLAGGVVLALQVVQDLRPAAQIWMMDWMQEMDA